MQDGQNGNICEVVICLQVCKQTKQIGTKKGKRDLLLEYVCV